MAALDDQHLKTVVAPQEAARAALSVAEELAQARARRDRAKALTGSPAARAKLTRDWAATDRRTAR